MGKDFRILNLKDDTGEGETHTLLLGNLLSFYEQPRLYEDHHDELRLYNLEKPLWVFVGSTVNAVYTENGHKRSDVLTVARFLHKVLQDRAWAVEAIERLLKGESGLRAPDGSDVFLGCFPSLKERGLDARTLYTDILQRVFHGPSGGGLHLADIRGSQGEIGLKAAGAAEYFGLIYIGDTAAFKKLAEEQAPEMTIEEEAIRGSLFNDINRPDSRIHVLIGAKKFMEGWNSWRVSTMGLLNIGKQEGSQIIQLFGRSVRLKGKDLSLKRSAALPGEHPKHITSWKRSTSSPCGPTTRPRSASTWSARGWRPSQSSSYRFSSGSTNRPSKGPWWCRVCRRIKRSTSMPGLRWKGMKPSQSAWTSRSGCRLWRAQP